MTQKERILAAASRQSVDKIAFGARIDLWYNYHLRHNTLPENYKNRSMVEILRELGAGIQLRLMSIWETIYSNVEIDTHDNPPYTTTIYKTPVGTVTRKSVFTPDKGYWIAYDRELPFKTEQDYPVIEYLIENTTVIPDYSDYYEMEQMLGDDGLVITGMDSYSPMQQIMRSWMGYSAFFYELHDHPDKLERLYELEKVLARKKLEILAESPVEIPLLCANWSDDIHTPIFKKYFAPWLREAVDFLHSKGKLTQVHTDGEMKRLIPMFVDTGVDLAEGWSPAPMTSVTTEELRKAWGDNVTIWGGLPAILFGPQYSDEEFDKYATDLIKEIVPGNNFIIGMGDNLPFDGKIDRVGRVVELIEAFN